MELVALLYKSRDLDFSGLLGFRWVLTYSGFSAQEFMTLCNNIHQNWQPNSLLLTPDVETNVNQCWILVWWLISNPETALERMSLHYWTFTPMS